ncbi:ribonuclease III [Glaciecola sp. XM2]|jgi:ribonuclease-3|uniref:ribonuclease III n=1 Tax=Glaciecola sp. XM2 TaxID=1914931 RepID=UPI001BDE2920|nr:ribonuclease III [Glaciecola sp. XM2]MBT1452315.1 ribonuclease III [Glaciecola sp. XM2]
MTTLNAPNYQPLFKALSYEFQDKSLLEQALTHRSAGKLHNERLEFLGDAILGLCVAEVLYLKFPKQPEGKLTRMRSMLVKGQTLSAIARELSLGEFIRLGSGEMKSGGHRRDSILADAVEALLGAIYLESGLESARTTIENLFASRIINLDPNLQIKDNKTQLQEYLQAQQIDLPNYEVVNITGKDHAQIFEVLCTVASLELAERAKGKSRRIAEQEAAKTILEKIHK